jgi:hypothetical protein
VKKPSGDALWAIGLWAIFVIFIIGMIFWANNASQNARENEHNQVRCETIDADYIAELDKCVIDNKIVEVPGR